MDPFKDISRKKMILLVFTVIFLQITISTYYMAYQKTGFFADDLYSYGYANSPGTLSPLEKNGRYIFLKWIDSAVIKEYLTVSHDERFSFGRITKTLARDAHPPLFYYVLHAVCSLTPDMFSKWSAYSINVVGFLILQVFLYRLSLFIGRNRLVALLVISFFGTSSASINMMMLLRMYILGTGFTVAFSFYAFRYLYGNKEQNALNKDLLMSFVFLYLSSMTLYLSVLYSFFLTLYVCVILLIDKQPKKMFVFGVSMLLSVGLMYLSFPTVFNQLFGDQVAIQGASLYPYMLQLRTCIYVISNGLFGINTPIFPSMIPFYTICFLTGVAIIYALVHFLFRNDEWFLIFQKKALTFLRTSLKKFIPYLKKLFPFIFINVVFILLYSRYLKVFYYREMGMRYFYILTPFAAMTILLIILKTVRNPLVCIILTVLIAASSFTFGSKCYLEKELDSYKISSLTRGCDVIVIENDPITFMYHLIDLKDCNSFLFANPQLVMDGKTRDPLLEKAKESDHILLMVDQTAGAYNSMTYRSYYSDGTEAVTSSEENDMIEQFRSIPGFEEAEHVRTFFGTYLYRLK